MGGLYCGVYFQVRFNLMQYIVPEVKEVYNWLEVEFHPLKLSGRVTKVMNGLWFLDSYNIMTH